MSRGRRGPGLRGSHRPGDGQPQTGVVVVRRRIVGPVSTATYSTVDGGQRALHLALTQGLPAQLAIRTLLGGQPLGIGDEAYAGSDWAIARRAGYVIMIHLHAGAAGVDPYRLRWLLSTATTRLPTHFFLRPNSNI
jgi:hypothetical protein